jgi:hypothetical protein
MAHKSRLRRSCEAPRECIVCGCTDANACMTEEGPCYWIGPDLCSNPSCLAKVTVELKDGGAVVFG